MISGRLTQQCVHVCGSADQADDVADLKRGRFREFEVSPLRGSMIAVFHAKRPVRRQAVTSFGEKHRHATLDLGRSDYRLVRRQPVTSFEKKFTDSHLDLRRSALCLVRRQHILPELDVAGSNPAQPTVSAGSSDGQSASLVRVVDLISGTQKICPVLMQTRSSMVRLHPGVPLVRGTRSCCPTWRALASPH